MSHSQVISLRAVRKSYGALEVLRGVDLSASKGEVVSPIGSSGSGKSTLLRCANLLETFQGGDLCFAGDEIRWRGSGGQRAPADRKQVRAMRMRLGMVFQQFNLWTHFSILENVMEAPVTVHGMDRSDARAIAKEYLSKVGLSDREDFYPQQLSGGQQQRAAIARALAIEPEAMLFDEPTSALDPELEAEVVRVIEGLAAEGRTMILVTHDMKLAANVSDKVVFLHHGRIEEEGHPTKLFEQPKSERLRQFLAAGR